MPPSTQTHNLRMQRRVDRPEQELNTAGVYAAINARLARIGVENTIRLKAMQKKLAVATASCDWQLEGTEEVGVEAPAPAEVADVLEKGTAMLYQDKQSGEVLEVTVVRVHYDDRIPYYTIRLASGQERETVRERLWRKINILARSARATCQERTVRAESSDGDELVRSLGPLSPGVTLGWGSHTEEDLVLGPLSPGFQLGWAPRRAADASELIQNAEAEIYLPAKAWTAFRQDRLPAGCSGPPIRQSRR